MELKLQRTQKEGGMINKSVIFCLDARTELTEEEKFHVQKYKLGNTVIYNSEASRKHLEKAGGALMSGSAVGMLKAGASLAMARLNLNITIDSLSRGQHIECKDLDELLGAEEAIKQACEQLVAYLKMAATFDGHEEVVHYEV